MEYINAFFAYFGAFTLGYVITRFICKFIDKYRK